MGGFIFCNKACKGSCTGYGPPHVWGGNGLFMLLCKSYNPQTFQNTILPSSRMDESRRQLRVVGEEAELHWMHESARPAPVPKGELPVRRDVRRQMVRFAKTDDSAVVVTARPAALPPRR